MPRPIHEIAKEIKEKWPKISPYAAPYLDAMRHLDSINDYYYLDSAESVVLYFLANAQSFKGEDARRLKKELKDLIPSRS